LRLWIAETDPPFPLYWALPSSEYYEGLRLLPALPPSFGFACRLGRTRLRATPGGLPVPGLSRFPPCRGLRPRRGLRCSCHSEHLLLPSGLEDTVGPRM